MPLLPRPRHDALHSAAEVQLQALGNVRTNTPSWQSPPYRASLALQVECCCL
jgi:hypothetical protein